MRIAGVIAVTVLVAACSQSVGGRAEPSGSPQAAPPSSATAPPLASATRPPGRGTSIEEVIAWIDAGTPADPGIYHEAFSDGQTTRLGDDIAFTAPSGAPNDTTQCITDAMYNDGALACLVELDSPAPRPSAAEGVWKAGWIDYSGTGLQIGSLHGDPGPFIKGVGPALAEGQSLAFGDNRCRTDATGLLCVNYAHRSAVWISAGAVLPFGCLQPVPPPPEAGAAFSC